jgi:NTE family protein
MKTGFCFTGEGARGAIQAGIVKGLDEMGVKPDLTIGISSGSICSASYSYLGANGLFAMWKNVKNIFSVFGLNYNVFTKSGILNQNPMKKIVLNAMKNNPICESIVSKMNIETGELAYVSNFKVKESEFIDSVLASVAITGLVEDRNGWVDAGSRQLAPLKQAVDLGCDKIYVIMGRPFSISYWNRPKGFFKHAKMAFRALDISLQEIMIRDISQFLKKSETNQNVEIFLVEPNNLFYDSVEFNKCKEGVYLGKDNFSILDRREIKKFVKNYE